MATTDWRRRIGKEGARHTVKMSLQERCVASPMAVSALAHGVLLADGVRSLVDVQFAGFLAVAVAALPYVVEILSQVPLLTRVMAALPAEVRAKLPPHPRRPQLAIFGSARFFISLFRHALRNDVRDPIELVALKREMRASAAREAVFGTLLVVVIVVAWRHGWRPLGI